jgi:outer membrane protein TolC
MPPLSSFRRAAVLGLAAAVLATGCARFEPARARREQTDAFTSNLNARIQSELAQPLSLDDCIRIAMTNNYAVRKADLDRELYRIGKNVAFTAFLPTVAATAGYSAYEKPMPQQHEQRFGTADLTASMPVFMPSTWFLYAATRHGYAAAATAAHYVRQGIVLQTTVNYFNVLVQLDTLAALETQLDAARQTADRVGGLADEGLAARWEGDQARFAAELRETELTRSRRQLAVLRANLLQGLGLPPDAPIELSGDTGSAPMPAGSLEDLVLKALEIHPELAIADRQVVIQDHQVRQAFCNFLPTISLFSTGTWTGNDLAAHAENWVTGFRGAWTLFDGLANVARVRAAKVERQQTRLERENTFLSVMVGVVAAEAAVRDAAEAARVRGLAYDVAAAKWADYDAKAREGLLPLSDALDARAAMDLAQVALVQSRYQERMAIATLELAMGLTLVPETQTETKAGKSP